MENKKQPEIRISGFNEKWEKRKLGDYIIPYNKVTTKNNQYPVFTSSRKGLFFQKDYYDGNQIASDDNTGYNIVPRGYFTYRHMSDDLVFKFNINNLADNGIVSTLYPVFKTTKELDSKYLQYQLNEGNEFKRFAILQKQGGSRTYMYLSKLKNMYLTMPKVDEQIKLSVFFKEFDDFISLHQQELTTLKQTKQGFLQKMFPKEGEKVPKVRFPGFTDDWKQHRISDVADIIGGGTPSTANPEYWNGEIDWYAPAEIGEQIYVSESQKKITKLGLQKSSAKLLPVGTVLFTSRAGIGNTAILAKEGATNQGFQSIIPHQRVLDSYFIFSRTHELKHYGEVTGAGSTFVEVSGKQMGKMIMLFPSFDEQVKIGSFFKQFDETIVLHQRELELLQLTKKAFLQKLFV
ncbi:restriction endonuclease subunit S [Enterococcus gilvus]|uniref:restriction endonuclease subunit S n=1 Tax=Enterococcus gilvus TaxID=160453 RepID=UPI003ED8EB20